MIELMLPKEMMLIKQVHQKCVIFVTIGIFLDREFKFQRYICNGYNDVLMISIDLNNIAVLDMNGADYLCIINIISKSDALSLLKNADLTEK